MATPDLDGKHPATLAIDIGGSGLKATVLDPSGGMLVELAHPPFHRGRSYEHELGEQARRRFSKRKWNKRVAEAIERLRALTYFDHLYLGGGNAKRVELQLPEDVSIVDNSAGVLGGIKLWEDVERRA